MLIPCRYVCVDVWMCGCVDVWMCGCVDVWMCGCVDVCVPFCVAWPSPGHGHITYLDTVSINQGLTPRTPLLQAAPHARRTLSQIEIQHLFLGAKGRANVNPLGSPHVPVRPAPSPNYASMHPVPYTILPLCLVPSPPPKYPDLWVSPSSPIGYRLSLDLCDHGQRHSSYPASSHPSVRPSLSSPAHNLAIGRYLSSGQSLHRTSTHVGKRVNEKG
ncbi:hypothetical protein F5883DRAFT_228976 [Diaporthe sp. PMI_573]|nr:hypothetical protein F5883DRAFT_228976 [Diaporthaceae sp. PMI_573]